MSRDDEPTSTARAPGTTAQSCVATDHIDNARGPTCMVTMRLSPGANTTRSNPASDCAAIGTGALAGAPR